MSIDSAAASGTTRLPLQPGKWFAQRNAGVLLHPTALPGPRGGELGPPAHRFIDFLAECGFTVWQTLPVGPVNETLSPYQPLSMLAGNPDLVNPEVLIEDGLLDEEFDRHRNRRELCREAFETLSNSYGNSLHGRLAEYRELEADWLEDHVLFLVLDRELEGADWTQWPEELRRREPSAIKAARSRLHDEIAFECFLQWQFRRQWQHLRHHANRLDIRIFGDMPIYPALHSADVWLEPELFQLDANGKPLVTSGTPPDAFTDTGQQWGTPIYEWTRHVEQHFAWWLERMRLRQRRFDLLRIDHFRGLAECWAIPSGADSAAEGEWQAVPGRMLLQALAGALPDLELVAEDLGHITRDVHELRKDFGIPGMRVLQFAFDGENANPHQPSEVDEWSVYYSGTHDNSTLMGWWNALGRTERDNVVEQLGDFDIEDLPWPLLTAVFDSRAGVAIAPLQDFLGLDNGARFNIPGTSHGNWLWRLPEERLDAELAAKLRSFLLRCGRIAPATS